MYLPYIMLSIVYGLRLILWYKFPANLNARKVLVFMTAMYALVLLVGCFTGTARFLALSERGGRAQAEVIFSGICTDNIFITGRHNRMYKKILMVPAESYDANAQPFTNDLGEGSLIYQISNASAKASAGAMMESVVAVGIAKRTELQLAASARPLLQHTPETKLPVVVQDNAIVAASAGNLALQAPQIANQQRRKNGFACTGYRFFVPESNEWVYAQDMGKGSVGSTLELRYSPNYLEENWDIQTIAYLMENNMQTALGLLVVLAETLYAGYWLGIRKHTHTDRKLLK